MVVGAMPLAVVEVEVSSAVVVVDVVLAHGQVEVCFVAALVDVVEKRLDWAGYATSAHEMVLVWVVHEVPVQRELRLGVACPAAA